MEPTGTWPPAIQSLSEEVSLPSATLPPIPSRPNLLLQAHVTDNGMNYLDIWLIHSSIFHFCFSCSCLRTKAGLQGYNLDLKLPVQHGATLKNNHLFSHSHLQTDWSSQLCRRILQIEIIHYWIITRTRVSSQIIHLFSLHQLMGWNHVADLKVSNLGCQLLVSYCQLGEALHITAFNHSSRSKMKHISKRMNHSDNVLLVNDITR